MEIVVEAEFRGAYQKVGVLQLVESLRDVSETCRLLGVSGTQFYEYKRRFQTHEIEGAKVLPPISKSHLLTTPYEQVEPIQLHKGPLSFPRFRIYPITRMFKMMNVRIICYRIMRFVYISSVCSEPEEPLSTNHSWHN